MRKFFLIHLRILNLLMPSERKSQESSGQSLGSATNNVLNSNDNRKNPLTLHHPKPVCSHATNDWIVSKNSDLCWTTIPATIQRPTTLQDPVQTVEISELCHDRENKCQHRAKRFRCNTNWQRQPEMSAGPNWQRTLT